MRLVLVITAASACQLWAATPVTCSSPTSVKPQATEYFVSLANNTHYLAHVSIRFPQAVGTVTFNMPVWNALYQVRDFAANVENVRASDASGRPVAVVNSKTSEWEITAAGSCVVVDYDIHLDNDGPFGSQLNPEHGFFNWAMVLMYSPATRPQGMSLQLLDVPANWGLQDIHILGEAPAGQRRAGGRRGPQIR